MEIPIGSAGRVWTQPTVVKHRRSPWGRDLSLAALRSPGRCHPSRVKSEAAEHGSVQGRLWRAAIVQLECQQSCGRAAVLPGTPGATRLSPSTARTSFPPGKPGSCRSSAPAGWSTMTRGREMSFPRHFQGGQGRRRAAKPLGSRQRLRRPTRSPQAGQPQGRSLPASNILLDPTAHGHLSSPAPMGHCCEGPHPGDSSKQGPATPLHQPHGSHPQAQEIHMSGALQQHKGGSLLAVGIRS